MTDWDSMQSCNELGIELVQGSFISHDDLAAAEEIAGKTDRSLSDVLLEQGTVDYEVLESVHSLKYGVGVVNLTRVEIQPEAVALVSEQVARELHILPIAVDGDTLTIAIKDPRDFRAINSIGTLTRKRIEPVIPIGMSLDQAIDNSYTLREQIELQVNQISGIIENLEADVEAGGDVGTLGLSPVVQAVEMLLRQAVRDRASDIHIEPQEDCVLIRNRIDGVLHDAVRLPLGVHSAIMPRI